MCIMYNVNAQEIFIYNGTGNKIYFNKTDSATIVNINTQDIKNIEQIKSNISSLYDIIEEKSGASFKIQLTSLQKQRLCSQLGSDSSAISFTNELISQDSAIQWTSNKIFARVYDNVDILHLLREYSVPYSSCQQFGSDAQTYLITLSSREDSSIEYSNILYESKQVFYSQPSFYRVVETQNPYYPNQWGLNNTGQNGGTAGIDINAPEAWNIATGANVKVAVLDEGIDLSHEDLSNNLLQGYDATDGIYGGYDGGYGRSDCHGTRCAGIIAAEDNNIGVKGIAYNSKIIPIRIIYTNPSGKQIMKDEWCVAGIKKAWQDYGADVLSNSWARPSGDPNVPPENTNVTAISMELSYAATQGRNGKGCVVVFASGNNDGPSVAYPSRLDNVISVGAITYYGARKDSSSLNNGKKWGSNYGAKLDVVAPGVMIPTTDIHNNYVTDFSGTSAACPHVSAVAALILSVNPNLTQQQVEAIIENTAQKVRPDLYTYSTIIGHPNGTWNNEMGYGLVDAYAAVNLAQHTSADLYMKDTPNDVGIEPNTTSPDFYMSEDIWIRNQDDGIENQTTENPEYKETPAFVYVKVRNRGVYPYTNDGNDQLKLYWAKAGTGLSWPYPWNGSLMNGLLMGGEIGCQQIITSIAPGDETILKFEWQVPNPSDYTDDINHFCLLARIESNNDPMTFSEDGHELWQNVKNNNNIAWKNVTVVNNNSKFPLNVGVTNWRDSRINGMLLFKSPKEEQEPLINKVSDVIVTLNESLYRNFLNNLSSARGIKVYNEKEHSFIITDDSASINVKLEPREENILGMSFNFLTDKVGDKEKFKYNVSLLDKETCTIVGGEQYLIEKWDRNLFKAEAGNDTIIKLGSSATLSAKSIGETATYNWIDNTQDTVINGQTISVAPLSTQKYTLSVHAEDGFTDYDSLNVIVKTNFIESISPNPAANITNITYEASQATNAYIEVMNSTGFVLATYPLNTTLTQYSLNCSSLQAGYYTIILNCNGIRQDAKVLVIN